MSGQPRRKVSVTGLIVGIDEVRDAPLPIEETHRQRHALPLLFEPLTREADADGVADARRLFESKRPDIVLSARKGIPTQIADAVRIAHVANKKVEQLGRKPVSSALRILDRKPILSALGEALRRDTNRGTVDMWR